MSKVVQFQSLSSAVEAAFWHELGQKKIDLFKLDDKPQPIHGYYTTGTVEEIQPRICLDFGAFSNSKFALILHNYLFFKFFKFGF